LVANDADRQRASLLAGQLKRFQSPSLLVTHCDARKFPLIGAAPAVGVGGVRFDRVLCDVPCSGDGTLRKSASLWQVRKAPCRPRSWANFSLL
jgi:16S rRNA C967 or C1407 C5-methylase (RsmB/RsmF family)